MTNKGLQALIDKYGDRIIAIAPTSGRVAFFGYEGSNSSSAPVTQAVRLESLSDDPDDDVFFIKREDRNITDYQREQGYAFNYESMFTTSSIEMIVIGEVDNQSIDPRIFK